LGFGPLEHGDRINNSVPVENSFFTHGEAVRWGVEKMKNGDLIGRVAAFIKQKNKAFTFSASLPVGWASLSVSIIMKQLCYCLILAAIGLVKGKKCRPWMGPNQFRRRKRC